MKIRNGFVSNSSSTSFVLITPKETFHSILDTFSYLEKDFILELLCGRENTKILDKDFCICHGQFESSEIINTYSEIFGDKCDSWHDSVDLFYTFFKKFEGKENTYKNVYRE